MPPSNSLAKSACCSRSRRPRDGAAVDRRGTAGKQASSSVHVVAGGKNPTQRRQREREVQSGPEALAFLGTKPVGSESELEEEEGRVEPFPDIPSLAGPSSTICQFALLAGCRDGLLSTKPIQTRGRANLPGSKRGEFGSRANCLLAYRRRAFKK
ncbi:hypothetical protein CIHG_05622 [Coccidioides immitis H538.4]|uniref:Uncharacterized protein n=1 Tax=Coccidioides immitis H538.4 TaxID=396776 RepID=A0A0J8RRJ1_COCIT|nr:hypothetical protein CIHG_05622 [Coccidioides immitis H538.4]